MRQLKHAVARGRILGQSRLTALLFCALYVGGFYFFDSVIIMAYGRGLETQQIAVPFHAAYLGLCLSCVWIFQQKGIRSFKGRLLILWGVFWGLYCLRIILDGYVAPADLKMAPADYLKWSFGVCFFPMIAFSYQMSDKTARWVYRSVLAAAFIAGVVCVGEYRQFLGTSFGRIGDESETINPLTVGYIGSSLVGLALYSAVIGTEPLKKRLFIILAGGILGFVALALGASRGPIVAVAVCYVFIVASVVKRRKGLKTIGYSVAVLTACLYLPSVAEKMGSGIGVRFQSLENEFDTEGGSRMTLISDAWGQFLGHPILGSGLEEAKSGFYPHNVVIESFMATGLLGGMSFTLLLGAVCLRAWRLLVDDPKKGWLSVLFVHALIASLFSGALYLSNQLWYLMAAVLAASGSGARHRWRVRRNSDDTGGPEEMTFDDKLGKEYNDSLERTALRVGFVGPREL